MFVKSVSDGEGQKTVVVTLSDENSGGVERFFVSRLLWTKIADRFSLLQPVDEEMYDSLTLAAAKTSAIREASRLLGGGEKSERELKKRLLARKIPAEAATYAVALLKKNGYLNDSDACLRIAESAVTGKHYGKRRIIEYLITHGYRKEDAEEAVGRIPDETYADALHDQLEKKYASGLTGDYKERAKVVNALMRLGFSSEEITDAIREYSKNKR